MEEDALLAGERDFHVVLRQIDALGPKAVRAYTSLSQRAKQGICGCQSAAAADQVLSGSRRSAVIQNLPPVLFTLMKSTEPWSDEYYVLDLEEVMRDAGLQDVVTVASDPRHRTVCCHV